MDAPGTWQADTNSDLNSGAYVLRVRWAIYLEIPGSFSTVCTIYCVHTILRDCSRSIKMGLPAACV